MQTFSFSITDRIKGVFILSLAIFSFACKGVFEDDITNEGVNVIIPQNNSTLSSNNVHFKWDEVEGADGYRLQVVQPSFTNIQTFELDSLVTGLEFYWTLDPGDYQFQLRAENSAYETAYVGPFSFTVDSVLDLSNQIVSLSSPQDLFYTNQPDFTATWQSVFAADNYEFQLRTGQDFNSSGTIIEAIPSIAGLSYTTTSAPMSNEGFYSWGVKSANQNSQSDFSSRVIGMDQTLPNDVNLLSPSDLATGTTGDTVIFKWSYGTDPGIVNSPILYYFEIDEDTLFGSAQIDTTSADSIMITGLSSNQYFWRVYAQDEAGNISAYYSQEWRIIVP